MTGSTKTVKTLKFKNKDRSSIFSIDVPSGSYRILRLRSGIISKIEAEGLWDDFVRDYTASCVRPEYRDEILRVFLKKQLVDFFETEGSVASLEYMFSEGPRVGWNIAQASPSGISEDGSVTEILITIREVTERKERELTERSERKYYELFDEGRKLVHDSEMIIDIDRNECRFLKMGAGIVDKIPVRSDLDYMLLTFKRLFRDVRSEAKSGASEIYTDELDRIFYRIKNNLLAPGDLDEIDYHRMVNGREKWFRLSVAAVGFDITGKAHYAAVDTMDITQVVEERKRLEARLGESEESLRHEMEMLRSFRSIYSQSMYIDVNTGSVEPIMLPDAPRIMSNAGSSRLNLKDINFMNDFIKEEHRKSFEKFFDMSTLDSRFAESNVLSIECEGTDGRWYRGNLIPVNRDENGRIAHIMLALQDISGEVEKEHRYMSQLRSLTNAYDGCLYHDLDTGEFTDIKALKSRVFGRPEPDDPDAKLDDYLADRPNEVKNKHIVHDARTLNFIMSDKDFISREYRNKQGRWKSEEVIAVDRHSDGSLRAVMLTQRDISDKKQEQLTAQAMSVAISRTYEVIFRCDLENNIICKINNYNPNGEPSEKMDMDKAVAEFEKKYLTEDEVRKNHDFWDMKNISEKFKETDIIIRDVPTVSLGLIRIGFIAYKRDEHDTVTELLWLGRRTEGNTADN